MNAIRDVDVLTNIIEKFDQRKNDCREYKKSIDDLKQKLKIVPDEIHCCDRTISICAKAYTEGRFLQLSAYGLELENPLAESIKKIESFVKNKILFFLKQRSEHAETEFLDLTLSFFSMIKAEIRSSGDGKLEPIAAILTTEEVAELSEVAFNYTMEILSIHKNYSMNEIENIDNQTNQLIQQMLTQKNAVLEDRRQFTAQQQSFFEQI